MIFLGFAEMFINIPSLKVTYPLKIEPGKGDSYWKASFLGAMLVSGRVGSRFLSIFVQSLGF